MKSILLFVSLAIGGHVVETIGARLKRTGGGTPISMEVAPYFVRIKVFGYYACGGSLISPEHVLTAAYCVSNETYGSIPEIRVVISTDKYDPSDLGRQIEHITPHRGCRVRNSSCDIAVITLLIPLKWNGKPGQIELPNAEPRGIVHARFIGIHIYKSKTSDVGLQELTVSMNLDSPTSANIDDSGQVFYGPFGKRGRIGQTDLGGPLIYEGKIIGVAFKLHAIQGYGCYFINVAKFKTFIEKTTGTKRSSNSQRSSVILWAPKRPRT